MKSQSSAASRDALERVADRYRKRGYVVHVLPSGKPFPPQLISLRPDLIIEKQGVLAVVEVNYVGKGDQERIGKIARKVAELGWKLLFVVLRDETQGDETPDGDSVSRRRVHWLQEEARRLLATKHLDAAFVMAWAALEGALRHVVKPGELSLHPLPVRSLLSAATNEGYISQERLDQLRNDFEIRNAVVHAVTHPRITKASVLRVIRAIRELQPERMAS